MTSTHTNEVTFPPQTESCPPTIESFICVCGVVTPATPFVCVTVCCSVLQCVAVCRSVSQCVAVCCSVLQCVAMWKCRDSRYSICVCGTRVGER